MRSLIRQILDTQILQAAIALIFLVVVAFMLPQLPQVPGVMAASAMKFGRVLDEITGQGIPNALVIVQTVVRQDPFFVNNSGGCTYRYMTKTHADGSFFIPEQWPSGFGLPFMHSKIYTGFRVFKRGYISPEDEEFSREELQKVRSVPRSVAKIWPTTWRGLSLSLDPMLLRPMELSLRGEVVYFSALFEPGAICNHRSANEQSIRSEIYDTFHSRICATAPEDRIALTEAVAFMDLGADRDKFYDVMRQLEGKKWDLHPPHIPATDPTFLADNVCLALGSAGRPY